MSVSSIGNGSVAYYAGSQVPAFTPGPASPVTVGLAAAGQSSTVPDHADPMAGVLSSLKSLIAKMTARFGNQNQHVSAAETVVQPRAVPATETHQRFIRGTVHNAGEKPADIWAAFSQGNTGNCVTVAALKVAMMRFGHNPHGVFKHITTLDDGFEVTMRDHYKLRITHDELEEAHEGSALQGDPSSDVFVNAQFLFAVSAKRAQLENNDGRAKSSFENAMATLNDGEYPGEGLIRLGLRSYMAPTNVKELQRGAIGTISSDDHDFAVADGCLDVFGKKIKLAKGIHWKEGVKLI
jgi:hypothetical protein